jgi:hypothetical protein
MTFRISTGKTLATAKRVEAETDTTSIPIPGSLPRAPPLRSKIPKKPQAETVQDTSVSEFGIAAIMGTPTVGPFGVCGYFCESPADDEAKKDLESSTTADHAEQRRGNTHECSSSTGNISATKHIIPPKYLTTAKSGPTIDKTSSGDIKKDSQSPASRNVH